MFFKDQVRLVSPKIPQNKHQATHQSHSTCRCIQVFVKITLFWLEEKLEFLEKFRLRLLCNLNRLFFIVLAVGLMSSQKSIYCQCIGIRTPLFVLQREIHESHSKSLLVVEFSKFHYVIFYQPPTFTNFFTTKIFSGFYASRIFLSVLRLLLEFFGAHSNLALQCQGRTFDSVGKTGRLTSEQIPFQICQA